MDNTNNNDLTSLIDVVFIIEGTAVTGAYINELKLNYILPTLEYLRQISCDDHEYLCNEANLTQYGIVLYNAASSFLEPVCNTFGPYTSTHRVLECIEELPLFGGSLESCTNLAEGLATALCCFEDLQKLRQMKQMRQCNKECSISVQKLCILICNSPPYTNVIRQCRKFSGKTGKFDI